MGIIAQNDFEKIVEEEVKLQEQILFDKIVRQLTIAGEKAVNVARSVVSAGGYMGGGKPYTPQTGNLTSSIGYVITCDGQVVSQSSFNAVRDGSQGGQRGEQYAKELAAQHPQGFALILVAGMQYASYVQDRGYDVLASGTLIAERLVNKLKKKI